jgi:hypothetical protein
LTRAPVVVTEVMGFVVAGSPRGSDQGSHVARY